MSARPVQISIDEGLLKQIDRDPETRKKGRSAFIRSAVNLYLKAKKKRKIDQAIANAYEGKADEMLAEIEELIGAQSWPSK